MRVALHDNGGKGALVAQALRDAGHTVTDADGDVAVTDHTALHGPLLDRHDAAVLYPHGGNPQLDWDGHLPFHPHVRTVLVHGPGHAEVMAAYGLPARCVPVGWCFGPVAEPRWPRTPRRVLFAPAHPNPNGYLADHLRAANADAFEALMATGLEVAVRLWHATTEDHGLPSNMRGVAWERGGGLDHADIDASDVVVSDCGTVAHLALARGVPLVMIGSRHVPDLGHDHPVNPASWSTYAQRLAYPFDLADGDALSVLAAACSPCEAVEDYRSRFVGGPFRPDAVVAAVEALA